MYLCALIFCFFLFSIVFGSFLFVILFFYSLLFNFFLLFSSFLFLFFLVVLFFVFLIFSSYILTVVLQTRTLMIYTFPSFCGIFRGGQAFFDPFGAKLMYIPSSSSSFIEPPATGHHQWSGAKRFSKNYFHFYNTFYNTRTMVNDIFDKTTKMAAI
jgi:hypothetical protein